MPEVQVDVPLSERELEVLEMVSTGASNQQIARELVISVNTVKVHMRNIFEKMGVQSRTEASLKAIQEGWIVLPDQNGGGAEAEVVSSTTRTFLNSDAQPLLAPWQYLYLTFAVLGSLVMVILPLLPRDMLYIPVITPYDDRPASEQAPAAPTNGDSDRWTFHAAMPTGRAGLALIDHDEKVYAIGGLRGDIGPTSLVEVYDPMTDSWSEGTAKPTAVTDISTVVLDDKIYVPGGCREGRKPVNRLEIYDPKSDEWGQGPTLPEARCAYGLVAWEDSLYLFGGWNGQEYEDTIFVFSITENRWEALDSTMPRPKGYFGVATLSDTIYVVGGYDGEEEFDTTYVFAPDTKEWQEKGRLNEKRGGLGLVSAANNIYAVGGGWERPVTSSEKYDPATDTWTVFEAPFPDNQWSNLGLTAIDTKIYAVGGWNGTEEAYMDSLESYQFLFEVFLPISGKE